MFSAGNKDALSCATSLFFATLTGVLRLASDEHYLSDVVVAAVVGAALGVLVPLLALPARSSATPTTFFPMPPTGGVTFAPTITVPF